MSEDKDYFKGYVKGYVEGKTEEKELMKNYVAEKFPQKKYKIVIRERKKNEIFLGEILVALFVVFMLVMVFINYQANLQYQYNKTAEEKEIKEIDVGVGINKEKKLDSAIVFYDTFNAISITINL